MIETYSDRLNTSRFYFGPVSSRSVFSLRLFSYSSLFPPRCGTYGYCVCIYLEVSLACGSFLREAYPNRMRLSNSSTLKILNNMRALDRFRMRLAKAPLYFLVKKYKLTESSLSYTHYWRFHATYAMESTFWFSTGTLVLTENKEANFFSWLWVCYSTWLTSSTSCGS